MKSGQIIKFEYEDNGDRMLISYDCNFGTDF